MPKKYDKETKIDTLVLLTTYKDINTVHQISKIPRRTLYRWREQMNQKPNRGMAQKNNQNAITASQTPHSRHNPVTNPEITPQPRHKTQPSLNNNGDSDTKSPLHDEEDKSPLHSGENSDLTKSPLHSGENSDLTKSPLRSGGDSGGVWREPKAGTNGIPGKTYPYPLAEDELTNTDHYAEFKKLRANLMEHAQKLAADLSTSDDNISLRTLALARILDRVLQLDQLIPQYNPERIVRFEYVYEGSVHNVPPWRDPPTDDPT